MLYSGFFGGSLRGILDAPAQVIQRIEDVVHLMWCETVEAVDGSQLEGIEEELQGCDAALKHRLELAADGCCDDLHGVDKYSASAKSSLANFVDEGGRIKRPRLRRMPPEGLENLAQGRVAASSTCRMTKCRIVCTNLLADVI